MIENAPTIYQAPHIYNQGAGGEEQKERIGVNDYNVVKIDDKIIMAQNLREVWTGLAFRGDSSQNTYDYVNGDPDTLETYGYLYNARCVRDIVDNDRFPGWHIPSRSEFKTLFGYVGCSNDFPRAGYYLKSVDDWFLDSSTKINIDAFNFTLRPNGERGSDGTYNNFGKWGTLWTRTTNGSNSQWFVFGSYSSDDMDDSYNGLGLGYGIRLIKD